MKTGQSFIFLIFVIAASSACALQQYELPADLKDVSLHDAACVSPAASQNNDAVNNDAAKMDAPELTATPIRAGGREVGSIVAVRGACHCQAANCDQLVYLRTGQGYRLALHEKYASLHSMKIVKLGMPSLTGQLEVTAARMETTVYDWDGKDYHPRLCATVIKGKRVPSIMQHPCKAAAH